MVEVRHEALVGAAMLGLMKAKGWMEMPAVIDVNGVLAAAGPISIDRDEAVAFTRGLIDQVCDYNGWPRPDYSPDQEAEIAVLLGLVYDELVTHA
jgi:hypothetical protein